ncbi:unnamed protein product [Ascophyllum nodosum]
MASLWLCEAAAGATAFVITDALLPVWQWRGIDVAATMLNITGSSFAGLAKGGARADDTADVQTALSIVMNGFLAVWTSFTFTVEHASHLAVTRSLGAGVAYLLCSVLVGAASYVVAYRLGTRWRVSRPAVEWAKKGPLQLVSGVESTAVLGAVVAAAWGGWMAGQHAEKLFWGIVMAVAGGIIGNWFSSLNQGTQGRVNWGNWRCNALAFAGLVSAGRYAASLEPEERQAVLESAFFPALVGQGIGTISGFSDLSADAGDLAVEGDYKGAAANIFLNVATAGFALLARIKFEKILLETPHGN